MRWYSVTSIHFQSKSFTNAPFFLFSFSFFQSFFLYLPSFSDILCCPLVFSLSIFSFCSFSFFLPSLAFYLTHATFYSSFSPSVTVCEVPWKSFKPESRIFPRKVEVSASEYWLHAFNVSIANGKSWEQSSVPHPRLSEKLPITPSILNILIICCQLKLEVSKEGFQPGL